MADIKCATNFAIASEENFEEFENILNHTQSTLKEIEKLEYTLTLLDKQRFKMEEEFGFDPKNFVSERINGKDYYNKKEKDE